VATVGARARRARIAGLGRVDARMLVGIVLVAVSIVGGLVFWRSARQTVAVVVAARDLPAGHVLTVDDLDVAQVKLEGQQAALAISADELDGLVGSTVGDTVHAGTLLVRPDLASGPVLGPDDVAITLPVRADSVYQQLRPGDAVMVLATRDEGKPTSQTSTLLNRATVYAVSLKPSTVAVRSTTADDAAPAAVSNVTLLIPRAEAEGLAHAAVSAEITLAILAPQQEP
jgi:pilus assembly protein CpaB